MNDETTPDPAAESGTCEAPCSAFRVVGDHPIMLRPDKVFRGENAQARANAYASVLSDQGYENVAVEPLPNAEAHGRSPVQPLVGHSEIGSKP